MDFSPVQNQDQVSELLLILKSAFLSGDDLSELNHSCAMAVVTRLRSNTRAGTAMIPWTLLIGGTALELPCASGGDVGWGAVNLD